MCKLSHNILHKGLSKDSYVTQYSYDPRGLVNAINYSGGKQAQFAYNKNGALIAMMDWNGTVNFVLDALNRITSVNDQNAKVTGYTYDSLGNLVYEKNANGNNKGNEYWYNNLNQQIRKQVDGKDYTAYTFDKRGNLVKAVDEKKNNIVGQYVYDATNRMAKGTKYLGTSVDYEESHYIYNGLGYLVGNEWVIAKNGYGYHGVGTNLVPSEQVGGVVVCDRHTNTTGQGHINPTGKGHTTGGTMGGVVPKVDNKNYAVVHKDYVLDYTSPLQNIIMETESGDGGLTYRYSYGLQKENIVIYGIPNGAGSLLQKQNYPSGSQNIVKLYYHHDRLGSTDYLTDNIAGKVTSYATYDDFGELTAKAIVKMGVRMLDLVQEYTGHSYDQVLGLYYAKARMYDAQDRRFMAMDWVKGTVVRPETLNLYVYVINKPLIFIDPLGLMLVDLAVYAKAMGATVVEYLDKKLVDVEGSPGWSETTKMVKVSYNGISQNYILNNGQIDDSVLNAKFGWKYSWIPNNQTHAAYIGVSSAFIDGNPLNHASIIVFVAPGSEFYENAYDKYFKQYTGCTGISSRYVTFGGEASGPTLTWQGFSWGHVVTKKNRDRDVDLSIKKEMISLNVNATDIQNLFESDGNFKNNQVIANLSYAPAPTDRYNTYNSNSFARGLLDASDISYENPSAVPGWARPIPTKHFQ
jgi:RHS repeat-associated protein